ncbi:von Willebrand factor type A domain-containing protein [Actinomadura pelletieri DSM 43383]|uniref:von Willebrand factor type A domain-containing protein n=1 Tax=Actinomadura pelletieri DSM 43383 TaxID=1120940 RepID=A0A495Q965_9ACTN|nr:vWA domain-containing protein [Actinomadura pelletieri]RKS67855.1 von Willebrand factor type A domain-containing protein [Actinomadura pelletieri DSM 43383]
MSFGPPLGKPPWSEHVREIWLPLLGVAVPASAALAGAYGVERLPLFFVGCVAALLFVDGVLYTTDVRRLHPPRIRRGGGGVGVVLRTGLAALTGAAVAVVLFVGWTTVPRAVSSGTVGCGPPAEVPVMAAPENIDAVQDQAEKYAEHEAEQDGDGCAPVRVTVFEAPPPGELEAAFTGMWDLAERPRPKVWVPGTRAAVSLATGEPLTDLRPDGTWIRPLGGSRARLRTDGSFGTPSPLVLAASRRVVESLGLTGAGSVSWNGLLGRTTRLVLPRPERTESGLAGVFALFSGSVGDDGAAQARRRELFNMIDRDGGVPDDPGESLCRLRELDADDATIAVAFVPLASIEAYNSGLPCGVSVLPREEHLVTLRPSGWTPAVDRPIVQVRWGGEDEEGNRFADGFGDWLARHGPPPAKGPAGSTLTPAHLTQGRDLMAEARRPFSIEFLLDYSATMNGRTRGGTRLTNALTIIDNALTRFGRGDRVGLWRFPGGPTGRAPAVLVPHAPADDPQTLRIRTKLDQLRRADAGTTPLYHAITTVAEHGTGRRTLVVLTDGEDDDPAGDDLSTRRRLRDALDDADSPDVHVLALTGAGCAKDLVALEATLPRFHCVDGKRTADAMLDALFAGL